MTQARLTQEAQLARARANEQRMHELRADMVRLRALIDERRAAADRQTDERVARIIRGEVQRLEGTLDGYSLQFTELQTEMSTLRTRQDDFDTRLSHESGRITAVVGRVDGLQAHSNAHATAIARLEAANGWIPIIGGIITTFVVYFIIEGVELLRDDRFTTQNQWFWAVLIGAIVGLVLTCLPGNGRSIITRSSASASGNVVVAPQPPADQPAPAAGVTPPPPPPSGNRFSTVQTAAAASASASN